MSPELGWSSPARESSGAKPIALVVDCELVVRSLLQNFLEFEGIETLTAACARQALALFHDRKTGIDLLVTEVNLPGMSGLELADSLSTLQPEVRILLISGYIENALSAESYSGPNRAFLAKPFTRADLAEKLRQLRVVLKP